ncbi:MAG: SRPBCC family protein [Pseudomonadota bacterium]|nr:SRPBCC family protein [Pseudomonadota bacterium]
MLAHTESVTLEAPAAIVYAYLADPGNLPKWANVFCQSIEHDGNGWRAQTVAGQIGIRYECHEVCRTIDIVSLIEPGVEDTAYTRVMPNGAGCEFTFTFYRDPDMSDELFDSQRWGLREELRTLRAIIRQLSEG